MPNRSQSDTDHKIDLTPEAVGTLLRNLHDPTVLGESPLSRSQLVTAEMARLDLRDSAYHRGLVLSSWLSHLIKENYLQTLDDETSESLSWAILNYRYVKGWSVLRTSLILGVSARSLARHQDRGLIEMAKAVIDGIGAQAEPQ